MPTYTIKSMCHLSLISSVDCIVNLVTLCCLGTTLLTTNRLILSTTSASSCHFISVRVSVLKEVQCANEVHYRILFALKNFLGCHIIVGVFGILKGAHF